jgi:hypothetical protein
MEEKADPEIEWHPGQVKQRHRPSAGQEAANLIKVSYWL